MIRSVAAFLAISALVSSVEAASIESIAIINTSSANDAIAPATFQTESTTGSVILGAGFEEFTHRMAFANTYAAPGGAAQVHKRNVVYQLDFTVSDPLSQGYIVDLTSLLRGASAVNQMTDGGTAFANGANFFVTVDDSTDAVDTYSNLVPLFNDVNGVSITGMTSAIVEADNTEGTSLSVYFGTTNFSLRFSTVPTPTTNILFGNGEMGTGQIDFGLGDLAPMHSSDPATYGHFVTVRVTSLIPEPATVSLVMFASLILAQRRV